MEDRAIIINSLERELKQVETIYNNAGSLDARLYWRKRINDHLKMIKQAKSKRSLVVKETETAGQILAKLGYWGQS